MILFTVMFRDQTRFFVPANEDLWRVTMLRMVRSEITKDLRKLHNDEFQSIYYTSLNIVRVIK